MSDRNLQYSEGIKPEHSNPNHLFSTGMWPRPDLCAVCGWGKSSHKPTEEVINDWNRGSNPGQGGVLLLDGTRSDALTTNTTGRNLCSPERLLATRINDARYQGYVRRDIPEAQGPLGGIQRDCSRDLEIEPIPNFGWQVHASIAGASVVAVGLWFGLIRLAHYIFLAVTR